MTLPLHERIRTDIEGRILSGELAPGDRLPTEHEMMVDYGCARMTVNKALSTLARAGLIDRRKRAGSFVAPPRLHSMILDIPDLKQQVLLRGQAYRFELVKREVLRGPLNERAYPDLGTGRILSLIGLHHANGQELAIERRGVSLKAAPDMEHVAFETEPPGTWLLHNVPWTEAETRISAVAADEEVASVLRVEAGAPLLQIERRTWRGSNRITSVQQSFRAEAYDLFAKFSVQDVGQR